MQSAEKIRSFKRLSRVCAAMLIGAAAGCAAQPAPKPVQAASNPVIVRLVSRHEVITITAGSAGPLYTVADSSGRVLVSEMTMSELKNSRPDLYREIAPTLSPTAVVWAGD